MIDEVVSLLKKVDKISVLTGAGISVHANIPDFRGEEGIYTKGMFPEEVFDIDYFINDPRPFYEFARSMFPIFKNALPTLSHRALKKLEKFASVCIITQNIDLLHELAGSTNVIHLHGSIKDAHCLNCGKYFSFEEMETLIYKYEVPRCDRCNGIIKPDVVFFGESVLDFDKALRCVKDSQLFFALGTSLEVFPANSLVEYANKKVLVNKNRTPLDHVFDYVFYEDVDEFFKKLLKGLEVEYD